MLAPGGARSAAGARQLAGVAAKRVVRALLVQLTEVRRDGVDERLERGDHGAGGHLQAPCADDLEAAVEVRLGDVVGKVRQSFCEPDCNGPSSSRGLPATRARAGFLEKWTLWMWIENNVIYTQYTQ